MKNNLLKGLLVTAICASSLNAATNKTFLSPRSQGVNLAMEYTTFGELIMTKGEDRFGAHFQVVPFYQQSTSHRKQGRYFGVDGTNNFEVSTDADSFNVWSEYLIHGYDMGQSKGTINLAPKNQAYGARIDYYQDLEKLLKGLYLKVAIPIVCVKNDMHIGASVSTATTQFTQANLYNYLNGTFHDTTATNAQNYLTNAKIAGSHSKTSVADLDLIIGYKIWDRSKFHFALNLGLTFPTGSKSKGTWLFEPMVGNGQSWGFGGGLDTAVKLWEKNDQDIKLALLANYRYLFRYNETRTLGYKPSTFNWSQYMLFDKETTVGGTPLANILTRRVGVTRNSQFDAILNLSYNNGGFSLDLGYNMFLRAKESVKLRDAITDGQYALLHGDAAMNDGARFEKTDGTAIAWAAVEDNGYLLNNSDIDTSVAASPSQFTNKIYGGLGYMFKNWKYPLLLGLGGSYEWANSNAIQDWAVWGKLGIAF